MTGARTKQGKVRGRGKGRETEGQWEEKGKVRAGKGKRKWKGRGEKRKGKAKKGGKLSGRITQRKGKHFSLFINHGKNFKLGRGTERRRL